VLENEKSSQTHFKVAVEIPASPQLIWKVMADVEHWPEWTPSVSRIRLRTPGPLEVGSRARIHQPRLLPAYWRVTELTPGFFFTWVSVAPGVRVTARHSVKPTATGGLVTLSIRYEGIFGSWLARWVGDLNQRYLALEAGGLKSHCAALAATPYSEYHEAH